MIVERQHLMVVDGDLLAGVERNRRSEAERLVSVPVVDVPPGPLDCSGVLSRGEGGFGLLAVGGLLCGHVGQGPRTVAELVGAGDVFRPWDLPGAWASVPTDCRWNTMMPSRLAILDREFAEAAAPFPEIAIAVHKRGLERAAHLATVMALTNYRRVDIRLLFLFWHLADRFGSVAADEITIPLLLTHAVIAEMASLRRPSVTTGLSRLESEGLLRRTGSEWRLQRGSVERLIATA